MTECNVCLNTTINPTVSIGSEGTCNVCQLFKEKYCPKNINKELNWLLNLNSKKVFVGISGGKDSTATLITLIKLGFEPEAFTFNTGYYPLSISIRAMEICRSLNIKHENIEIQKYISPAIRDMYRETAKWYDNPVNPIGLYKLNRQHYKVSDETIMPFVRSCQICRKVVIKAYYGEAIKRGFKVVILGMNEWTHLANITNRKFLSGIRKLKPYKDKSSVYIVHLPFLLEWKLADTKKIVKEHRSWQLPKGENFVESNSNSCSFALAAEETAYKQLGFHPDTTRLSREISCGFIKKETAKEALNIIHRYDRSVSKVLQDAFII